MRPNRRYSNPFTTNNAPKGPFCSHCDINLAPTPAYIVCASLLCDNLPICVACFSVGAAIQHPHQSNHPYRVIRREEIPLFAHDWSANDEQRLLYALAEYGPNHWRAVSEYVGKSVIKCEKHYHDTYLDSNLSPFPVPHNLEPPKRIRPTTPIDATVLDISAIDSNIDHDSDIPNSSPPSTPVPSPIDLKTDQEDTRTVLKSKPNAKAGKMEGFMPLREEFDVEFDDAAEKLIADLSISLTDTQEERQLKFELLNIYCKRVKRRWTMMDFIFKNDVLDFAKHKITDRRATRDEKELIARLRVFSRLLKKTEFQAFYDSVLTEYRISRELYRYARGREIGIMTKPEVDIYEIERKTRNAAILNTQRDVIAKKRGSIGKSYSGLDHVKHEMNPFSPSSPEDHAVPSAAHSPAPSDNDIMMLDTHSPVSEQQDGTKDDVPGNSSSTLARRARERRRVANSPFPQVEAMPMTTDPNAWKLSPSEIKMCAALRISATYFLKIRDAMLLQGSIGLEDTENTNNLSEEKQTTLRAARPRRKARTAQVLEKRLECAKTSGTKICRVDSDPPVMQPTLDKTEKIDLSKTVATQKIENDQDIKKSPAIKSANLATEKNKSSIDNGSLPGSTITEVIASVSAATRIAAADVNQTRDTQAQQHSSTTLPDDDEDCIIVSENMKQKRPATRSQKLRELVKTGLTISKVAEVLSADDLDAAVNNKRRAYNIATVKVSRPVTRAMTKAAETETNPELTPSPPDTEEKTLGEGDKAVQVLDEAKQNDEELSSQAPIVKDKAADYTVRSTAANHTPNSDFKAQPNVMPNMSVHTNSVSGDSGQADGCGSHDNSVVVLTQEEARGITSDIEHSIAGSEESQRSGEGSHKELGQEDNTPRLLKRKRRATKDKHVDRRKRINRRLIEDDTGHIQEPLHEAECNSGHPKDDDPNSHDKENELSLKKSDEPRGKSGVDDDSKGDNHSRLEISIQNDDEVVVPDNENNNQHDEIWKIDISGTEHREMNHDPVFVSNESTREEILDEGSAAMFEQEIQTRVDRNLRSKSAQNPVPTKTNKSNIDLDKAAIPQVVEEEEILDEGDLASLHKTSQLIPNEVEEDDLYIPRMTNAGEPINDEPENGIGNNHDPSDSENAIEKVRPRIEKRKRGRPRKDDEWKSRAKKKAKPTPQRRSKRLSKRGEDQESSQGSSSRDALTTNRDAHKEDESSSNESQRSGDGKPSRKTVTAESGAVRRSGRRSGKGEKNMIEDQAQRGRASTRQSRYSLREKK